MIKEFSNGNELLRLVYCRQPVVPRNDSDVPLTWAMVVIQHGDRYLLHHNFNRAQWECAGGGIEDGETRPRSTLSPTNPPLNPETPARQPPAHPS